MLSQRHNSSTLTPGIPASKELLWTLSSQAIFHSISTRLCRITGWENSDWVGKPLQAFIHPSDLGKIKDRFREVLAGRTVRLEQVRCLMKDGDYLSWTVSLVPQNEGIGVAEVLVLGHLEDEAISPPEEPTHPLNALRLHNPNEVPASVTIVEYAGLAKLLEGMLGNAPIGFALLDAELRFICVNQTFSDTTGFSPSQQLGQPLRELLPHVADLLEPVMRKVLATGESVLEHEVEFENGAGIEFCRFSQMSFYPIPDLHGGICGVATIAVDITDRKTSEAKLKRISDELVRSNLALEEFSYVASHDLKEPLRTVASFVQLLRDRYHDKLDADALSYIENAVDGTQRMQSLIEKILEYSRAGKIDRVTNQVNCTSIVQAIMAGLRASLEESGGTISYESLPTVHGDETLLHQVFQNLIANALKFKGSAPPTIHVSAKRDPKAWVFSIADNGIGIRSNQFANIFAPFRKLHSRSEFAGSGLGLAICKKNVERQGGKIWVTSEEGKGSIFSFTIPAAPLGDDPKNEIGK